MEPLNLAPNISLRQAAMADLPALLSVCLQTGDSGADATGNFFDPEILGRVYAAPYVEFSPEFSFVITAPEICGYLLAALDTKTFESQLAKEYWPALQAKYQFAHPAFKPADLEIFFMVHSPEIAPNEVSQQFPSHMHIDLLPKIQGQGIGRAVIESLFEKLINAGSTGVHLNVGISNVRAQNFYRKLGFKDLQFRGDALLMGKQLR
ncbi:MAG: GNAT family N-acetyltransferase [Actinomycetes bacterium]|jgi:ribosomal protein S18 acetylase RimI-like enzyme